MKQAPVLQIRNLSKRIGQKTIIDQLSFDVPAGEIFGFLGPNGAGKTTTIRMLVGLMSITEGEVLINNVNIEKDFEKAMMHVGAIVENPELYKFMTGYQNLLHFSRMISGLTKHRIDEVVELVGLHNRIHDKVKTYSLGMRQRLGVAQAILHKPNLLILDEPTNGLDPAGIRELRDYLRHLSREEGIAVIVSSHLLSEMELMCDRIAIIQNGKLVDVKLLTDMVSNGNDLQSVVFELNDATVAATLLEGKNFKMLNDTHIQVEIIRDHIAEINALFVQNDIQVFGIKAMSSSLEDRFLEMTRGEEIV